MEIIKQGKKTPTNKQVYVMKCPECGCKSTLICLGGKMIRHRIKKIDKVDINDSQLRDVINNFNESDEYERMIR